VNGHGGWNVVNVAAEWLDRSDSMPKFQVSLKRTETWLADIVIEADSPEDAFERAEKAC